MAEHRSCLDDFDCEFFGYSFIRFLAGAEISIFSVFWDLCSLGTKAYFLLHFIYCIQSFLHLNLPALWDFLLNGLALGTITGGVGITIAHELMHRTKKVDRFLSKLIMASVLYGHFCIEHVKGHHVRVATPNDPATAKRGQSLYAFFLQSISGTLLHSFRLQKLFWKSTILKCFLLKMNYF